MAQQRHSSAVVRKVRRYVSGTHADYHAIMNHQGGGSEIVKVSASYQPNEEGVNTTKRNAHGTRNPQSFQHFEPKQRPLILKGRFENINTIIYRIVWYNFIYLFTRVWNSWDLVSGQDLPVIYSSSRAIAK